MSFVVGAYLWTSSDRLCICSAAGTVVSGLSISFNNNRISGSQAVTSTIGGRFQKQIKCVHLNSNFVCSFNSNAGPSAGSSVRPALRSLCVPFWV